MMHKVCEDSQSFSVMVVLVTLVERTIGESHSSASMVKCFWGLWKGGSVQ